MTSYNGPDLRRENLIGADFTGRDLTKADLTGADLTNTIFFKAILNDAVLINTQLNNTDLIRAELRGADFTNAQLLDVGLNNANLTNAKLINAQLLDVGLNNANLTNAKLINAQLLNVKLINSNLTDANLTNAVLTNANLEGAILTGTMLDLTRYGLPQDSLQRETLITLTNPDNLSFLLCLRDKIRNLNIKDVPGPGDGLSAINQGLNNFTRKSERSEPPKPGRLATQVLNYSRFGRHVFGFLNNPNQFDEIKRQLLKSLPLLYSFNYKHVEGKNIDEINEFCREIIERKIEELVIPTKPRASLRGGKRKPKSRKAKSRKARGTRKIKFSKKV